MQCGVLVFEIVTLATRLCCKILSVICPRSILLAVPCPGWCATSSHPPTSVCCLVYQQHQVGNSPVQPGLTLPCLTLMTVEKISQPSTYSFFSLFLFLFLFFSPNQFSFFLQFIPSTRPLCSCRSRGVKNCASPPTRLGSTTGT